MLYLVKARPIVPQMAGFWTLLNNGTIEAQKPDGGEIVASMRRAVMNGDKVEWHETCFCNPPLRHERATIYDQFFTDLKKEPLVTGNPPSVWGDMSQSAFFERALPHFSRRFRFETLSYAKILLY